MKKKNNINFFVKITLIALFAAASSYSWTYFVDPNTSCTSHDGSLACPFLTVQDAYNSIIAYIAIGPADGTTGVHSAYEPYVINILSSTMDLSTQVTLNNIINGEHIDFTESNNLTIQSYYQRYDERTLIYSSATSVNNAFYVKVSHVKFNMLKFAGGTTSWSHAIYSQLNGLEDITIQNCVFSFETNYNNSLYKIGSGISLLYNQNCIVDNVYVLNNIFIGASNKTGAGIYLGTPHAVIANNTFYRMNYGARIDNANFTENILVIKNNIGSSLCFALLHLYNGSGPVKIDHDLAYDFQDSYRFVFKDAPNVTVSYSDTLLRDPGITSIDILASKIGTILPESPCIDNGATYEGMPSTDFYTLDRKNNPDIGAVEFNNTYAQNKETRKYVLEETPYTPPDPSKPIGDSLNPYGSIYAAFAGIPGGLAMRPYTIVLLPNDGGNYSSFSANIHCNFTKTNPLTIRAAKITLTDGTPYKATIAADGTGIYLSFLRYVNIQDIFFKGLNSSSNYGIRGAYHPVCGGTNNTTVRRCKFICTEAYPMTGIYGPGDSLKVENCVFYSSYANGQYRCIDKGTYGGACWTVSNNTILGTWGWVFTVHSYADFTSSVFVNNLIYQTVAYNYPAFSTSSYTTITFPSSFKNNYIYGRSDANQTVVPQVNMGVPSDNVQFGMPAAGSPLIDAGYNGPEATQDDYLGKYDALGKRDIGGFEVEGFEYTDASVYSRNLSGNVVAEMGPNGKAFFTNIYGNGLVGKEVRNSETSEYEKGLYYIKNHQGSTMVIVSDDGGVADKIQYAAFGMKKEQPNAQMAGVAATETYTGKSFDEDGAWVDKNNNQVVDGDEVSLGINGKGLGLYYFGARYYDPVLGMFISQDPDFSSVLAGYSSYAFCNDNPISNVDPDGRFAEPIKPVKQEGESEEEYKTRLKEFERLKTDYSRIQNKAAAIKERAARTGEISKSDKAAMAQLSKDERAYTSSLGNYYMSFGEKSSDGAPSSGSGGGGLGVSQDQLMATLGGVRSVLQTAGRELAGNAFGSEAKSLMGNVGLSMMATGAISQGLLRTANKPSGSFYYSTAALISVETQMLGVLLPPQAGFGLRAMTSLGLNSAGNMLSNQYLKAVGQGQQDGWMMGDE